MQPPDPTNQPSHPYASVYAAPQSSTTWLNPQPIEPSVQQPWQGLCTGPQPQPAPAPWQQPSRPQPDAPPTYAQQQRNSHSHATPQPLSGISHALDAATTYVHHLPHTVPQTDPATGYLPASLPHAAYYPYSNIPQPTTTLTSHHPAWPPHAATPQYAPSYPHIATPPWAQHAPPPAAPGGPWQAPQPQPHHDQPQAASSSWGQAPIHPQHPWTLPQQQQAAAPPPWSQNLPPSYPPSAAAAAATSQALPPSSTATAPPAYMPGTQPEAATPAPTPNIATTTPAAATPPAHPAPNPAEVTPHPNSCDSSPQPTVIVWDLDETLIVFNSLITGHYCRANPAVRRAAAEALGQQWQEHILALLDTHFHYERLEPLDICHVGDVIPLPPATAATPVSSHAPGTPQAATYPLLHQHPTAANHDPHPSATAPDLLTAAGPGTDAKDEFQPAKRHRSTPSATTPPQPHPIPSHTPITTTNVPGICCQATTGNCTCHEPAQHPSTTQTSAAPSAAHGASGQPPMAARGSSAGGSVLPGPAGQPAATMQPGALCRAEPPATTEELMRLMAEVVQLYEGAASTCQPSTGPPSGHQHRQQQQLLLQQQQPGGQVAAGEQENGGGGLPAAGPDGAPEVEGSAGMGATGGSSNSSGVAPDGSGGEEGEGAGQRGVQPRDGQLQAVVQLVARAEQLRQATDDLTGGWLLRAGALLQELTAVGEGRARAPVTHVLVTTGQLVATLGKLLVFHLAGSFPAAAVYSASKEPKAACFQRILHRFGPACRYCVIGDGAEEDRAAAALRWPFIRVVLPEDPSLLANSVLNRPLDALGTAGRRLTALTVQDVLGAVGAAAN